LAKKNDPGPKVLAGGRGSAWENHIMTGGIVLGGGNKTIFAFDIELETWEAFVLSKGALSFQPK
jgi:hypothetical protein